MKSKIEINVTLDDNKVPETIEWQSSDQAEQGFKEVKAMFVALFDKETLDTYKIDLWTKELQVMEMDRFVFQGLRSLADTYMKATNNAEMANDMRRFVQYFGEKTGIIPPSEQQ